MTPNYQALVCSFYWHPTIRHWFTVVTDTQLPSTGSQFLLTPNYQALVHSFTDTQLPSTGSQFLLTPNYQALVHSFYWHPATRHWFTDSTKTQLPGTGSDIYWYRTTRHWFIVFNILTLHVLIFIFLTQTLIIVINNS